MGEFGWQGECYLLHSDLIPCFPGKISIGTSDGIGLGIGGGEHVED